MTAITSQVHELSLQTCKTGILMPTLQRKTLRFPRSNHVNLVKYIYGADPGCLLNIHVEAWSFSFFQIIHR